MVAPLQPGNGVSGRRRVTRYAGPRASGSAPCADATAQHTANDETNVRTNLAHCGRELAMVDLDRARRARIVRQPARGGALRRPRRHSRRPTGAEAEPEGVASTGALSGWSVPRLT